LVVAVTCVDLLTDWDFLTGENEGRIEREIFLGVKIVNAGTCAGKDNISVRGEFFSKTRKIFVSRGRSRTQRRFERKLEQEETETTEKGRDLP
jgi:hypothetical protein